ncbi:anthranilate phosphoribosyltransferase [bacterium]|nr:MAG: anthranilate phosphoribosyltransferase [bacterium]
MGTQNLTGLVETLLAGDTLDREGARGLMELVMDGQVPPVTLAAALTALRLRGETVDEITGFAEAMRGHAVKVPVELPDVVDTCGTGGDGSGTFNISTATALVVAAMGILVAKHGNRAVSSRSGSADVLEALGVNLQPGPSAVARMVHEVGIGFLFAPALHPAMKHAMPVRRELGVRTVFNLLGPLTNPAGAKRQLLGVYAPELCQPLARVLGHLGSERAYVVHGNDGLDEVSPTGPTLVAALRDGAVESFTFSPQEAGLAPVSVADLAGGSAQENAAVIRDVLAGVTGPAADAVVLNAAFVAMLVDKVDTARDGVALARETLAEGRGTTLLENLVARSHDLAREAS